LRFPGGPIADCDERQPDHVHLAGGFRREEIRDAQLAPFTLSGKGEAKKFLMFFCFRGDSSPRLSGRAELGSILASRARLIDNYIVPIALRWKISPHHFWLKQSTGDDLFFHLFLDWPILLFH